MRKNKRLREYYILGFLLLLAFGLRFYWAYSLPLWVDETNLVINSTYSFKDLFLLNYWDTAHPPLYNLFIKLLTMFTIKPLFLRLSSVLFGSLSLIYLYKIVLLVFGSKKHGYIAVFLGAVSSFLVMLSVYSRPYGWQQFLILGFLYNFFMIFHKKENYLHIFLFAVLSTLTDYSFLWVLMVLGLYSVWHHFFQAKGTGVRLFKGVILSLLPFVLWLPVFIRSLSSALSLEEYIRYALANVIYLDFGHVVGSFLSVSYDELLNFTVALLFFTFIFFKSYWNRRSVNEKRIIFILSFLPIIVSLIISYNFSPMTTSKNLFASYYFYLFGVAFVIDKIRKKSVIAMSYLLLVIAFLNISYSFQQIDSHSGIYEIKEHMLGFREEVLPIIKDDMLVLLSYGIDSRTVYKYYLNNMDGGLDQIKTVAYYEEERRGWSLKNNHFLILEEKDARKEELEKSGGCFEVGKNEGLRVYVMRCNVRGGL